MDAGLQIPDALTWQRNEITTKSSLNGFEGSQGRLDLRVTGFLGRWEIAPVNTPDYKRLDRGQGPFFRASKYCS